jgi:hypothetical protein
MPQNSASGHVAHFDPQKTVSAGVFIDLFAIKKISILPVLIFT